MGGGLLCKERVFLKQFYKKQYSGKVFSAKKYSRRRSILEKYSRQRSILGKYSEEGVFWKSILGEGVFWDFSRESWKLTGGSGQIRSATKLPPFVSRLPPKCCHTFSLKQKLSFLAGKTLGGFKLLLKKVKQWASFATTTQTLSYLFSQKKISFILGGFKVLKTVKQWNSFASKLTPYVSVSYPKLFQRCCAISRTWSLESII